MLFVTGEPVLRSGGPTELARGFYEIVGQRPGEQRDSGARGRGVARTERRTFRRDRLVGRAHVRSGSDGVDRGGLCLAPTYETGTEASPERARRVQRHRPNARDGYRGIARTRETGTEASPERARRVKKKRRFWRQIPSKTASQIYEALYIAGEERS